LVLFFASRLVREREGGERPRGRREAEREERGGEKQVEVEKTRRRQKATPSKK